jgi:hypothetical protein
LHEAGPNPAAYGERLDSARLHQPACPAGILLRAFDSSRPGERGFVLATWVRSYASHWRGAARISRAERHARLVQKILGAENARTIVACSEQAHDALHGWACAVPGEALHYVYVALELRCNGLARALIAAALGNYAAHIDTTHRWPFPSARFEFEPYRLMEAA